jgi:hypothetical protein
MFSSTRSLLALAMLSMSSAAQEAAAGGAGTSSTTTAAASAAAGGAKPTVSNAAIYNQDFYNYIFIVLASLIGAMTVWRVGIETVKWVRKLTCLNNDTQSYFVAPSKSFANFKKHLIYAPVFSKRHNREIQMSSALNVGTLPTRLQLLFLVAYFGTNVAFCVVSISWGGAKASVARELRNRTGILSVVNMVCITSILVAYMSANMGQVPLFIMASRNNPLINWTNMSFDTFNLLHRWQGRIVVLEAVAHVVSWGVSVGSWAAITASIQKSQMEIWGLVVSTHKRDPLDATNGQRL